MIVSTYSCWYFTVFIFLNVYKFDTLADQHKFLVVEGPTFNGSLHNRTQQWTLYHHILAKKVISLQQCSYSSFLLTEVRKL